MPSIEGGGVEKNFFLISNFLAQKIKEVSLITAEKNLSKKLKNINIIYPKSDKWRKKGRIRKYLICIFFLISTLLKIGILLFFHFKQIYMPCWSVSYLALKLFLDLILHLVDGQKISLKI